MAVGTLVADGDDEGTYALITGKGFGIEAPDEDHSPSVRHIRQAVDATLGRPVFLFDIHIGTDLNKGADVDRQRCEIKTDNSSPSSMVARSDKSIASLAPIVIIISSLSKFTLNLSRRYSEISARSSVMPLLEVYCV